MEEVCLLMCACDIIRMCVWCGVCAESVMIDVMMEQSVLEVKLLIGYSMCGHIGGDTIYVRVMGADRTCTLCIVGIVAWCFISQQTLLQ